MQFTYAQLTVTSGLSLTEYVQSIVGQGISFSNITYQGTNDQIGTFDGSTSNIGFTSGVVLAAGPVNGLVGPVINADARSAHP